MSPGARGGLDIGLTSSDLDLNEFLPGLSAGAGAGTIAIGAQTIGSSVIVTATGLRTVVLAGVTLATIYQFARQTNHILDAAKYTVRYKGPSDQQRICDYLNALYDKATSPVERLEICAAMKFPGCQRTKKDRGGPE